MLQIALGIIIFALPLLAGSLFRDKSVSCTYLLGQILLWACFQVIAVPLIHLRASFHTLAIAYLACVLVLSGAGVRVRLKTEFQREKLNVFFAAAFLVILYQAGVYILGRHLDEDDARWIAEANDALTKNRMLLDNPSTGAYIGRFIGEIKKDVFSPWSMYIACLSWYTGISPAVLAHTVYAPVLLLLSYSAYARIGKSLFAGREEQGIFLLGAAVINLFFAGSSYTQSVFTLTRIWQGKAVIAAVMIPSILMLFLQLHQEDRPANWREMGMAAVASCLFSGMGAAIGVMMTAVYGGYALVCRKFRGLPYYLASVLIPAVYGVGYLLLKS